MSANAYHKISAYKNANYTVSKTRQVVMLYDGMICFMQQARSAMEEGRIEDRFTLLTKTSAIVTGLQGCLDFEQNAEVSTTLYDYYAQVEADIFLLHRSQSVQDCDRLISQLKAMRETWHEIDRTYGISAPVVINDAMLSNAPEDNQHNQTVHGFSTNAMDALMISA